MRRNFHKGNKMILGFFAHFITVFATATTLSPSSVPPPTVGTTVSDIPAVSSATTPVDEPMPNATVASPPPTLECISEDDKEFKFILSTRRNSSGHWLADMDVQPGEYARLGNMPFEVQLEHRTRTCVSCQTRNLPHARISLTEPPPTRVPTGSGYRYFPGFGFYKRHLEEKSWHDARQTCKGEGADLVVINSEEEAKLLLELSAPLLYLKPAAKWNAEAYVGIYDFHEESDFSTVTGLTLNETGYVHWSPGEPNNHREEDCVTIVRNAMYNDVQCSKIFEFICELPE